MMLETIAVSILSFAGTNMDDLFINMLLFAGARTKREMRGVVAGRYIGVGMLLGLSLLGACGVRFLPEGAVSLLGFVPIALGVRDMAAARKEKSGTGEARTGSGTAWRTALATLANGADNLGVYIPLLAGFDGWQTAAAVCVFAVMTGVWCLWSRSMAEMKRVQRILAGHQQVLAPAVYIVLGVYVLLKGII